MGSTIGRVAKTHDKARSAEEGFKNAFQRSKGINVGMNNKKSMLEA